MNTTAIEKHATLNKPAVWGKVPNPEINARTYKANRTYITENSSIIGVASPEIPITRYVKAYNRFSKDFSVFIFSDEQDKSKIEEFLDKVAKALKKEEVLEGVMKSSASSFLYVNAEYRGNE